MPPETGAALARRIDKIEECYEFMLAYAAQGREGDDEAESGPGIRQFLTELDNALDGIAAVSAESVEGRDEVEAYRAFLDQRS